MTEPDTMERETDNLRLVVGSGHAAPGAVFRLAVRLADHAKSQDMRLISIRRSKQVVSDSCYITLDDSRGRRWIIRVSDHRLPLHHSFEIPHFDFVSIDGASGFDSACTTVSILARGSYPWTEAVRATPLPGRCLRRSQS